MLLPGPEAQQLAIYVGWLLHGTRGGLVAGIFFVLPAFVLLALISWVYVTLGTLPVLTAVFVGLRAVVLAIVAAALIRIAARTLRSVGHVVIAASAFLALAALDAPFPLIVAGAALAGWLLKLEAAGHAPGGRRPSSEVPVTPAAVLAPGERSGYVARVLVVGLLAWFLPLAAVGAWLGGEHVVARQAVFFSQAALVTFGGAYAVLGYVNQAVVERFQWLTAAETMDGLGLAESTPGPLIMVLEFVGFVAAYRNPGALSPLAAGFLGALVAAWATFAPCFLWIFLGAPFIESLRGHRATSAALSGITSAVVGVILNLALLLGAHTLLAHGGVRVTPCLIAVVAFLGLWRLAWPVPYVLAGGTATALVAWRLGVL